jgi:hypothetical protein
VQASIGVWVRGGSIMASPSEAPCLASPAGFSSKSQLVMPPPTPLTPSLSLGVSNAGVADGVGSWREHGVDPREYSHRLMECAQEYILAQVGRRHYADERCMSGLHLS